MLDITNGSLVYAHHRPMHVRNAWNRAHRAVATCARLIAHWADRARQRRILAAMDDRLLSDIGITRTDAMRECEKPFWR